MAGTHGELLDFELEDTYLPEVWNGFHEDLRLFGGHALTLRQPPAGTANEGITIVILGSTPEERFAHILEGNRQSRGNFFLAMSPTWLQRRKSKHSPDQFELYLRKAIWCDNDGAHGIWHLADFTSAPRRVTYFANFITKYSAKDGRNDGTLLEENLCTPQSSSFRLSKLTGDKLHTRLTLSSARVAVPASLALLDPSLSLGPPRPPPIPRPYPTPLYP